MKASKLVLILAFLSQLQLPEEHNDFVPWLHLLGDVNSFFPALLVATGYLHLLTSNPVSTHPLSHEVLRLKSAQDVET